MKRRKMHKISREHGRILILAEKKNLAIGSITYELLGIGEKIATNLKESLAVVVLGHEIADVSTESPVVSASMKMCFGLVK
jgi:hypothetical protein